MSADYSAGFGHLDNVVNADNTFGLLDVATTATAALEPLNLTWECPKTNKKQLEKVLTLKCYGPVTGAMIKKMVHTLSHSVDTTCARHCGIQLKSVERVI